MTFKLLTAPDDNEFPEVLWLKDYLALIEETDIPPEQLSFLIGFTISEKGYLLFTKEFKTFAFKGTSLHTVLTDLMAEDLFTGAVGVYSTKGKPQLVADQFAGDFRFIRCNDRKYIQDPVDPANPPSSRSKRKKSP
jgi:hypothetical protein